MIKAMTALGVLLGATNFSHAATRCDIPEFHLIPDVTVTAYMYVTSGKRCGIAVSNSAGGAQRYEVTGRPSNGKVEIVGLSIRYTSRPRFVGKDSFSYVRHALDARTNRPIRLPANIDVTVAAQ
jgi:hypothetical protein